VEASPAPAGATVLSGCVHCHQLVYRGRDGDPWRLRPARGQARYPEPAITCEARPGHLAHQAPSDLGEVTP
jgi:hypothetical protein